MKKWETEILQCIQKSVLAHILPFSNLIFNSCYALYPSCSSIWFPVSNYLCFSLFHIPRDTFLPIPVSRGGDRDKPVLWDATFVSFSSWPSLSFPSGENNVSSLEEKRMGEPFQLLWTLPLQLFYCWRREKHMRLMIREGQNFEDARASQVTTRLFHPSKKVIHKSMAWTSITGELLAALEHKYPIIWEQSPMHILSIPFKNQK